MERTIDRRTALQLGGAAAVAAVAGCSDTLGGGDDSSGSASYAQYLAVQDNQVSFAYADIQTLEELGTGDSGSGGGNQDDFGFEEPMLAPVGALFLIGLPASIQLASLGLSGLIQTEGESELSSEGNELLLANEALVVVGELDTDEVDSRLTSESGGNSFSIQYEQTDESGGYAFYEPAGGDSGSMSSSSAVVAVSGSELLTAENREAIDAVIGALDGDGRAVDEFDEFRWLLDNGGDGVIALGGYGPDGFDSFGDQSGGGSGESELDIVEGGGGFVGSISLDGESITSVLAASADEISDDQQSQIESEFQSDRTDVSIDFQGDGRLVAEAAYSRDVLDGNSSSDA